MVLRTRTRLAHVVAGGTLVCAAAASTVSQEAFAFRLIAGLGYESLQTEKMNNEATEPKALTGLDLEALAQFELFGVPGFALIGGAGLKNAILSSEDTDQGVKTESDFNLTHVNVEAGAQFSALPLLTLQAVAGYDFGVAGNAEVKTRGTTIDVDVEGSNRFHLTGRALLTVFPFLSVGLGGSWFQGELETKADNFPKQTRDFDGYAVKGLVSFAL